MAYKEINSRISYEFLKRRIQCSIDLLDILFFMQILEPNMSQKNKYFFTKYLSSFIPLYLALPLSKGSLFTLTNDESNIFILFGKDLFMLAGEEDYFDFCMNDMTSPIFWSGEHTSVYSEI